MRLSKSKILMFEQCPYRYLRTIIGNWKPPIVPPQLKKGIEVHRHIENVTKDSKTIKEVHEKIKKVAMPQDQVMDIVNFFNWQKKRKLPLYVEGRFFEEELNYSGVVDRVEIDENGKLIMIDYKTGKGQWYPSGKLKWPKYRFELAMYTYLFEKNHNQQIDRWGIYFTTKDKYVDEPVSREEIRKAVQRVIDNRKRIYEATKNKNWPKKPTLLCDYCELFQNKECDCGGGKMQDEFDQEGKLVL